MKYVVAVSGGVDSVVLLDMMVSAGNDIIVAHFDHGIRDDSVADARFVEGLARQYALPFELGSEKLGLAASEDLARRQRYKFLEALASRYQAKLVTAHHQDDVLGSIAINLLRGTGWRGLAVMGRSDVVRPLLSWSKVDIYDYALSHRLEWVEDSTNHSPKYLRNRLRAGVLELSGDVQQRLVELRAQQLQLARDIDQQLLQISQQFGDQRYPYIMVPASAAIELLRYRWNMTRPAASRLLTGIKTARAGSSQSIGGSWRVDYAKDSFTVKNQAAAS